MAKYTPVTGGAVSSLDKGISASSLGRLLKNRGLKVTMQEFDPYINVDPSTVNLYQYDEVYVIDDGTETDLDLGHYEKIVDVRTSKCSNVTTGKIYQEVLDKEYRGDYHGATVQAIPHITDMIKKKIMRAALTTDSDVIISEIGDTVDDTESTPLMETTHQMRRGVGEENVIYIHCTLAPCLHAAHETKTEPTQYSVTELRSIDIRPNMLILRAEKPISRDSKNKVSTLTDAPVDRIVESTDTPSLFDLLLAFQVQGMDQKICDFLHLESPRPEVDIETWKKLSKRARNLKRRTTITLVGKYAELGDVYISVIDALQYAGHLCDTKIKVNKVQAEDIIEDNTAEIVEGSDGLTIPSGFSTCGLEGTIILVKYVRGHDIPFLSICLGMQMVSVEFARDVFGLRDTNSAKADPEIRNNIINITADKCDEENIGGTLRLGLHPVTPKKGTKTRTAYDDQDVIQERHRHRYEFNNDYREAFEKVGTIFSGVSPDNHLVEIIEIPDKKLFIATRYHPEFLSRPQRSGGLFEAFIDAASSPPAQHFN